MENTLEIKEESKDKPTTAGSKCLDCYMKFFLMINLLLSLAFAS